MSECRVSNWKLRYHSQEQDVREEEEEEGIHISSHLNNQYNPTYVLPLSNYEVAELTWEKGQLALHGLGGVPPTVSKKANPTWGRAPDTLESIVHQATHQTQNPNIAQNDQNLTNMKTFVSSSRGKCGESPCHVQMDHSFAKKRTRSEPKQCGRNFSSSPRGESLGCNAGAGADVDASASKSVENQDEEGKTRGEIVRSHSTRRSRSATVHNQSERRRRDRINQKMKTLQKLVPNSNKTDKASMLDEVIVYLKQLKAQVQMMSIGNMPQLMMPLAMQQQQQLQMSLLARMGMGVVPAPTPAFGPPPFVVPHIIPTHNPSQSSPPQAAFNNPYSTFLSQTMNVDLYNKMAAVYLQQVNQETQTTSGPSQSNHVKEE
ncbi:hypothetical protein LguiB_022906 [Lonicera macranthoides]